MKKLSKYLNVFIMQEDGGQGWEDCGAVLTRKEAREDLKAYCENSPYPSRMITRRVLRADYESGNF